MAPAPRRDVVAWSKPIVFALCLVPFAVSSLAFARLALGIDPQALGPDPVAQIEHRTGDWALRFLLITLAITPLRRITGRAQLIRYRRMLGLFAFFYATLHVAAYVFVDLGLEYWSEILREIAKRPYITVGFAGWVLLIPLAVTSTKGMMRRLGRRWGLLHRAVYAIGVLAVLHYLWQVKWGNTIAVVQPVVYAAILVVLLAFRVPWGKLRGTLYTAPRSG